MLQDINMIMCSSCKEHKELEEFGFNKSGKDGHSWYCKKCMQEINRKWREKNPEKIRDSNHHCYALYAKKRIQETTQWRKNNPERARILFRKSYTKRRTTIMGKLNCRMSSAMRYSLGGGKKCKSWKSLTGYTVEELRVHIEKQFVDEMTWEKFKDGEIHIDHKIPISVFNFNSPEDIDFLKCWALENLQPLWKFDNLSKKDKLTKPFQPSLLMGGSNYV